MPDTVHNSTVAAGPRPGRHRDTAVPGRGSPEYVVTLARMVTESLLEQAQRCEQEHAAVLADPGLGPALARTTELLEEAELIENWRAEEQRTIMEAHRRGLSLAQWRDRIEDAIADAESPGYAQGIWEGQGDEFTRLVQDGDAHGVPR